MSIALDPFQFRRRLSAAVRAQAAWEQDTDLFSLSFELADLGSGSLPTLDGPYVYQARPDRRGFLLGLGQVWRISASGGARFQTLNVALRNLDTRWRSLDEAGEPVASPALFCALAFADDDPMKGVWQGLPNSLLMLPRLLLTRDGNRNRLSFSCTAEELRSPDTLLSRWLAEFDRLYQGMVTTEQSSPGPQVLYHHPRQSPARWQGRVAQALDAIGSGRLDKLVLARSLGVVAPRPFQPAGLLAALARSYPSCRLLAVNLGANTVVSASPERLAAVSGNRVRCDALGGTLGRSHNPGRDQGLSDALMNGDKARHEHALVVASIRDALQPLSEALHIPAMPTVSRLRNLQHLKTGIEGRLCPGIGLLEVVECLHPTAAVGGRPSGMALWWLRQHEGLQRGWYSGGFGWLHANGDGELSVMLRCAVLHGREAELFAGAGIVAGSDPSAEWRETEVKMQAMLEAMADPLEAVERPLSALAQR